MADNKPKLYFIPGTMCDPLIWSRIWPELEQDFQLQHLAIPADTDLPQLLDGLLQQINEDKANLVGFSMGGYLATCLAEKWPEKFDKVIVISNSPCQLPEAEMLQREQTINWLQKFQYRGMTEQKMQSMLAQSRANDTSIKQIMVQMEQNLGYPTLLLQLQATSKRTDKSEVLTAKQVAFSFCHGDEDKLVNKAWLSSITQEQNYPLLQVPDCGHMLPLEQPKALLGFILECVNAKNNS